MANPVDIEQTKLTDYLDSTQTSLEPYSVPRKLWEIIGPVFKTKFNVEMSETFPQERITTTTIVWNIHSRRPGVEGKRQQRGSSFTNSVRSTEDGKGIDEYTQYYDIYYDFFVFAQSSVEADRISWALEQALDYGKVVLRSIDPGITFTFEEQVPDTSFIYRTQDELIMRGIRYRCTLPVRTPKTFQLLESINLYMIYGPTTKVSRTSRSSTSTRYSPPTGSNEYVLGITGISLYLNNEEVFLLLDTDYWIKRDHETGSVYVEWNDELGRPPAINEQFTVYYTTGDKVLQKIREI